jgi:hypothetical protein
MPRYRIWLLADDEDPENDESIEADSASDAAEMAVDAIINEGDMPLNACGSTHLAVRLLPDGPAEMFEVYVDWSPTCTAHHRGTMPEQDEHHEG